MKRSPLPPRKAYIARSKKPIKRGAPPARMNLRQARRKADRYAAYMRSPEWKEKKRLVRQRSGGQCERIIEVVMLDVVWRIRCTRDAKVCNHKTYARFGHENLEDLEDLCNPHNEQFEAAFPYRASRRRYLATVEGKR